VPQVLRSLVWLLAALALGGCGGIAYQLPGHTSPRATAPVQFAVGERRPALSTPGRLPAPGGFALGLASEDPAVARVETTDGARGAAEFFLLGAGRGRTTVHYVNRFNLPRTGEVPAARLREASLGSFLVTVGPQDAPMPGSDTTTPHRWTQAVIGTAIIQDVRDGVLSFDFTADSGSTDRDLRVRATDIRDLGDTPLQPLTRLRLRLTTDYFQLGTTTPRVVGRHWELLRVP
jgi:hypothetical protein